MEKKIYLCTLDQISREMEAVPNTVFGMTAKVLSLAILNMRYERIAFNKALDRHPYELVRDLIEEQRVFFRSFIDASFIENERTAHVPIGKEARLEFRHREVFNAIWNQYDDASYDEYVERYVHRIRANGLDEEVRGKRCLDLGCGNGNFCFALAEVGAASVVGIDFGAESIDFALGQRPRRVLKVPVEFQVAEVYKLPFPDDNFDLIIQNGVFHHVEDERGAIREARRVLRVGGLFWYYTDGEGGISYDLWDRSVHLLREVPLDFIREVLKGLNVSVNKLAHLMDGLNAVYRHTSWKKMTGLLRGEGFGDFRRLTGGFPTDLDLDVIQADPYGRAKFGEGDLRILARLVGK
jgi:ubiquinone/menaquinone biosynthesis C-methylase UbiE